MAEFIDRIADVTVTRTSRTLTRPGFGTMLLAVYHALNADRVRSYTELSEMVTDGFTPYDAAYQMAAAAWAQEPSPATIRVGRRALPFTQVVDITPNAPVSGSTAETWTAKFGGYTATFTSDATPTLAEVCTGFAAAINALADVDAIVATLASSLSLQTLTGATLDGAIGDDVMTAPRFITLVLSSHADWDLSTAVLTGVDGNGVVITENLAIPNGGNVTVTSTKRYLRVTSLVIPAQSGTGGTATVGTRAIVTADGTSGTKVVCTSVAGELHSFELVTGNFAGLTTATTNPGIATDLAAILMADADWYGLALDSNGAAEIAATAAWVETAKKLFLAQTSDQAMLATGSVTVVGYTLSNLGYLRTGLVWRGKIATSDSWAACAWMGLQFAKDPGTSTFAHKTLAGQYTDSLSDAQRAAIESYKANHYTLLADAGITFPGKVAGNEWLDIIRDLDFLRVNLQYDLADLLLSNEKIPFTDAGIGQVVAAVRARLTRSISTDTAPNILADDPKPVVSAPRASAVSTANRQARTLPSVTFSARVAGAIHTIDVNGRVSA